MAETDRGLGERRIADILSGIPALAEARRKIQARPSTEKRAFAYVRAIWPDAEPRQIYSSSRDFILAEEAESCHLSCPGMNRCPNRGFRPTALCEPQGEGGRAYVVRWGMCTARAVMDSQTTAERALKGARIPERLKVCTFESYRTVGLSPDILKAKGMALATMSDGNSLILAGGSGVGKTHLAVGMVNARVASGKPALFIPVPELLDDLRKAISTGKSGEAMDAVKGAEFLALDDLGAERLTEWVGERLYMIVNHRYLHRLQTIVTTNSPTPTDLLKKLGEQGERIVSRLGEMGTWCGIVAEDYRFAPKPGEEAANRSRRSRQSRDSSRQEVLADIPF